MTDIRTIHKQLTQWHRHRQPYTYEGEMSSWDAHHEVEVPPLLVQLAEEDPANTGGAFHGTPQSRPPTSLDCIDTLNAIDQEASRWVRRLGDDDPRTTIGCVNRLYALAASAQFCQQPKPTIEDREAVCCDVHRIERDMRRWWTQARVVSGWDTPAWAPNNTCPMCGERRSLRIRLDDQSGLCTSCRETWDHTNIGLLAEHIRAENGEEAVS